MLNHLYSLLSGEIITDSDKPEKGKKQIGVWLTETINKINGSENGKYKNIKDEADLHMRAPTPFNTQSTRGFNIKKFIVSVEENNYKIVGFEEDWYYINCDNLIESGNFMEHKNYSIEATNLDGKKLKDIYIINVPGFEPPHGVATYTQLEPKNIIDAFEGAEKGNIGISGGSVFESSESIFEYGQTFVNNLYSTLTLDEKIVNYLKTPSTKDGPNFAKAIKGSDNAKKNIFYILIQGIFIVLTLNYMGYILKDYNNLNTSHKINDQIFETKDGSSKLHELDLDTVFNSKEGFKVSKMGVFRPKEHRDQHKADGFRFPNNKYFDKLNPFYNEYGKYLKFTVTNTGTEEKPSLGHKFYNTLNSSYEGTGEENFITKLIEILFGKDEHDKNKQTARMNINVIRPLREVSFKVLDPKKPPKNVIQLLNTLGKEGNNYNIFNKPINDGRFGPQLTETYKKNVIDSTLFSTLQGFCEIRDSDI
jgi:hypothetical protein